MQKTYNCSRHIESKIVIEYAQEIPQPQNADKLVALRGRATELSQDTRKMIAKLV